MKENSDILGRFSQTGTDGTPIKQARVATMHASRGLAAMDVPQQHSCDRKVKSVWVNQGCGSTTVRVMTRRKH